LCPKARRLALTLDLYLVYVLACIVVVIVPGPTVTVIVANSLKHGAKAGLLNVAGTQAGLLVMLAILALGLQFVVENLGHVFEWVRLAGAAYLVWLGVKMLRSDGSLGGAETRAKPGNSLFWQGFLVILSNPKALLFFGAFIPQFIDPSGDALLQTLLLGATFMVVATVLDGAYAVAAAPAIAAVRNGATSRESRRVRDARLRRRRDGAGGRRRTWVRRDRTAAGRRSVRKRRGRMAGGRDGSAVAFPLPMEPVPSRCAN
jgi:threonine/homoserine/homoserine lactone efflux protein